MDQVAGIEWAFEVLQLADKNGPTGRYRLTANGGDVGGPHAMCTCPDAHGDEREARECPQAREVATRYGASPALPQPAPSPLAPEPR